MNARKHNTSPLSPGDERRVDINAVEAIVEATVGLLEFREELSVDSGTACRPGAVLFERLEDSWYIEDDKYGYWTEDLSVPAEALLRVIEHVEEQAPDWRGPWTLRRRLLPS